VRRATNGFTLIELLLTMAIMAILAVIGIGSYTQAMVKSRDTQRKSELNQISKAIELFNNDVGRYPRVDTDGNMLCPSASDGPETPCFGGIYSYSDAFRISYIDRLPTDPVGNREYVYDPSDSSDSFALYAALENDQDRDVVVDGSGDKTNWGVSCGVENCNYKLTETGLVKVNTESVLIEVPPEDIGEIKL